MSKVNNIYIYIGIIVLFTSLLVIQLNFPEQIGLTLLMFLLMIFYLIAEIVSAKTSIFVAFLELILLVTISTTQGRQNQFLFSSIMLIVIVMYYFLIRKLRSGKLEKTSARENYFRNIIKVSFHPLLLKDKTGKIILSSDTLKDFLGLKKNLEPGSELVDFVHKEDLQLYKDFFREINNNPNQITSVEYRLRKNNEWIWVRNDAINLLSNKNLKAIVSSLQDITVRKGIDEQKAQLLQNEKNAREIAEKAVRDRDEFLSIASHELKTPLTTILLQLQATLRKISTQSLSDFSGVELLNSLQIAETQSKNLATLIKDLLNVSMASTGRMTLNKEQVNLSELTDALIKRYDEEIKLSECDVSVKIADDNISGHLDPVRIEQALSNIILNSLKYAKGKKVKISLDKIMDQAVFKISDKGDGISKENLETIFEPFNNVNTQHRKKGLGIGLFISRQIVLAHGGTIEVESQIGKGTTFTIRLPVTSKGKDNF